MHPWGSSPLPMPACQSGQLAHLALAEERPDVLKAALPDGHRLELQQRRLRGVAVAAVHLRSQTGGRGRGGGSTEKSSGHRFCRQVPCHPMHATHVQFQVWPTGCCHALPWRH